MVMIPDNIKKELLKLPSEEYTLEKIKELIANTKDGRKYSPQDKLKLDKNEYYNKEPIVTNLGRLIFNKVVLDPKFIEILGYQDIIYNEDNISKLDGSLITQLMSKKITTEDYIEYIDKMNWIGYALNSFLVASLSSDLYLMSDNFKKRRDKLLNDHKEAIENNDLTTISNIEKELMELAKEEKKNNPSMEIFDSGARGSFKNSFKNSAIIRGATIDPSDGSVKISKDNLIDGTSKDSYVEFANLIVAASFSRSKSTEKGGHIAKKLNYAFQGVMLDEKGSNCGSTKTIKIEVDDFFIKHCMYRYIVENNKLVLITPDNIKNYMGKIVNMRSPMYCKSEKYCNICSGDLYYNMDIEKVGTLANRQGNALMQVSMKAFHDATVNQKEINFNDYITDI